MEVVAAEPAGDVDHFADEVEAGDLGGFERFGIELGGGDASGGDLRLGVAFGAGRGKLPVMELMFEVRDGLVGEVPGGAGRVQGEPAFGPAGWERGADG